VIDEEYVRLGLKVLDLNIEKERIKGVTTQLQRIEQVAQALESVDLDAMTDEMAPVWRP
jgi:hypothetical protein